MLPLNLYWMRNCFCRGHLNMGLAIKAPAYFSRSVHGVLGQIAMDSHPAAGNLPKELKVCSFPLACYS